MLIRYVVPESCYFDDDVSSVGIYRVSEGRLEPVPDRQKLFVINNHVLPKMRDALRRNASVLSTDISKLYVGGNTYVQEGSISEIPKVLTDTFQMRKGQNNGALWAAAKADPTIIVVSPYIVGNVSLESLPGSQEDLLAENVSRSSYALFNLGWEPMPQWNGLTYIDGYCVTGTRGFITAVHNLSSRTYIQPVLPMSAEGVFQHLTSQMCPDPGLITETVAAADTACMDVLTAVAEMPETLRSVIDGLKLILKATRDVKRGQLDLSDAFARKKKRERERHLSSLADLQRKLASASSRREKARLERKIAEAQRSHSRAIQDTVLEFNTALASIWLNYRYNIMPTVLTIEDSINLYDSYFAMFKTVREKDASSFLFEKEGWTPDGSEFNMRLSCVIKRLINPNLKFSSLTKANFLATLWELIPLSFVIDWALNIGDLITAVSSPNLSLSEGSVVAYKTAERISLTNEDGVVCNIKWSVFKRDVIDPQSHVSLVLSLDMNWKRALDALALLWGPMRKAFLNIRK